MTQLSIENLLKQKIGLDPSTLGSVTIKRAISQCMVNCGLTDITDYLARLQTSTQELEQLIEMVVVPETWFFRDREPFVFLSRYVMSEWLPNHRDRVMRVLSIPCSTGEEPYSIAIALTEAGLATKNFSIDAVDISKKSLTKASLAIYSRNSFRGNNKEIRDRYFTQVGEQYQLYDSIKNTVNFIHGNLLDPSFLIEKVPYDVIFCRNVLIYFNNLAQKKTFQALERLLVDNGLLLVGHSETQLLTPKFVTMRHPLAFVYQKQEDKNQELKYERKLTNKKEPKFNPKLDVSITSTEILKKPKEAETISLNKTKSHDSTNVPTSTLKTAQTLAERGQLHEAINLCEIYLHEEPTSADAYLLLGQLCRIQGNEQQAEQCFQKAIYLEPNHYEALIHLVLLKERRGDIANADVIRQRIQRLQKNL
ncbi:tetratricopeptide repeat protein [Scytonema sp. UIC 10036]|uniref:CheR family methyltransferase n=1 Tax=Scytonema sp. UIC 10036 TaxID=2304196 RepID=UPI0012DA847D|nr:protein-glutamate O-methyltransferase CheR [Scytonema sp. UIC 10036]MUG91069.1 tetratricopeptide repeat protein [Scytonema sp. UIC 10036]